MKKHLSISGTFLAVVMLTAPAYAAENTHPYYISGNIGAAFLNDITLKNSAKQIQAGTNPFVQGALGRNFDRYRCEIEFAFQRPKATQIGSFTVSSVLINGYYDFPLAGVAPYLTAGAGYEYTGGDNQYINSAGGGYQFGAGIDIPVTKTVMIDARYRYFGTSTVGFGDNRGDFKLAGSSFLIGLKFGIK